MEAEVANEGVEPTFKRGTQKSCIDVTINSLNVIVSNWRTLTEENLSDHRTITYDLKLERPIEVARQSEQGWSVKGLNKGTLVESLKMTIANNKQGETVAELQENLKLASNKALPRKKNYNNNRKPAYWWTEDIAQTRVQCIQARRRYTRANRSTNILEEEKERIHNEYKTKKDILTKRIESAKKMSWSMLVEELKQDIWGQAYKIARKKLKASDVSNRTDQELINEANKLFPKHRKIRWTRQGDDNRQVVALTREELREAVRCIKTGKAPGPDGIPAVVIRTAATVEEDYVLVVLNRIWKSAIFPTPWKIGRLVLLKKPKKSESVPQAYRPLCLLNETAKLYERLINKRLQEEIESNGGLSDTQYGFRKGRSTVDALTRVREIAKFANTGAFQRRDVCVLITIDVKNAFNSTPWGRVIGTLQRKNIDVHLIEVIKSYFSDRRLLVGERGSMEITSGVPQGSVLGPTLWSLFYDGVLRLEVGREVNLIGFADDLAVVITAKTAEQLTDIANRTMRSIMGWMRENQLEVASEKTEAIVLVGRRKVREIRFNMNGTEVKTVEKAKYLGVLLNRNMTMVEHVSQLKSKTLHITRQLNMLMPNTKGPRSGRRKLLVTVIHSVILYAAPIWSGCLRYKKYKEMIQQMQRMVMIRAARAYRTVSHAALCVITGIPPPPLNCWWRCGRERTRKEIQKNSAAKQRTNGKGNGNKTLKRDNGLRY